jgi:hypothetical protein
MKRLLLAALPGLVALPAFLFAGGCSLRRGPHLAPLPLAATDALAEARILARLRPAGLVEGYSACEVTMRFVVLCSIALLAACSTPPSNGDAPPEPAPKLDIVVTTAVHGNEPSGYHVQEQLAEQGFIVFGPCNPWGLKHNKRHLENGDDLNRSFADSDYPEVLAVKKFLAENTPGLLLDLHEDPDGTGCYLIQHGPDDDIGFT